jgi:hypothetical protein
VWAVFSVARLVLRSLFQSHSLAQDSMWRRHLKSTSLQPVPVRPAALVMVRLQAHLPLWLGWTQEAAREG